MYPRHFFFPIRNGYLINNYYLYATVINFPVKRAHECRFKQVPMIKMEGEITETE